MNRNCNELLNRIILFNVKNLNKLNILKIIPFERKNKKHFVKNTTLVDE